VTIYQSLTIPVWEVSMKSRLFSAVIFALITTFIASAEGDNPATFTPQQPKIGDVISIQYNTGLKTAVHKNVKTIICEALIIREDKLPLLLEIPLNKNRKLWTGNFILEEQKAQFILFQIVSGEKLDDNNGQSWETLLFGSDGKALRGSHYIRGTSLARDEYFGFKRKKDKDILETEMKIERELYPDNYLPSMYVWRTQMRANPGDSTMKAKIKSEFEQLWEKNKEKEDAVSVLVNMFEPLGMKTKGDSIKQQILATHPTGKFAEQERMQQIFKEKDLLIRVELAEKYFADFAKQDDMLEQNVNILFSTYVQAGQYDKASAFLEKHKQMINGNYYNNLSWNLIEKGEMLEQATAWAKKGIDLLRAPDPSTKPSYMSTSAWKKNNSIGLGMILDTYAYGLFKLGKTTEAEKVYEEAVKLNEGKVAAINARLLECCNINGKYEKTLKAASEFIQKGSADDKAMDFYKTAYIKVKGSDRGFDKLVSKNKTIAENIAKKKITKGIINLPAIGFALKDLDGKVVKLSEQKGKVVILDFWATWCGPCKASFPSLQQVYNKYKENPNVKILTMNTWENVTGKEREELVKKFIEENKYSFTVLYDEGFVEKYGVEGIPTQFIIDKNGRIRFKSLGADSKEEMIAKIDLLLQ
jgi:thiol-disulfide isomerase/thioredoxin